MRGCTLSPDGSGGHALIVHVAQLDDASFCAQRAGEAPAMRFATTTVPKRGSKVQLRISGVGPRSMPVESVVVGTAPREDGLTTIVLAADAQHAHRIWALRDRVRRGANTELTSDHAASGPGGAGAVFASTSSSDLRRTPPPATGGPGAQQWSVNAGPWLLACIRAAGAHRDDRALVLPCPQPTRVGQAVIVTFSFGHGADAVEIAAVVLSLNPDGSGGERAALRVVPSHRHRVEYIKAVVSGQREPTRRRDRRTDVRVPATLQLGPRTAPARAEAVSESGLFVRSHHHPSVGENITISLSPTRAFAFDLVGEVRWHSQDTTRSGFGIHLPKLTEGTLRRLKLVMGLRPSVTI